MVACQDIFFISLILCQGISLVPSQGIQPRPKSRYSVSTIISTMSSALLSPYGTCSFPPNEVLTNAVSFEFLETCVRGMPSFDKPVFDASAIMCLGLLEVGLRVCSLDKKYFKQDVVYSLPNDSHSFNTLVTTLKQENDPNLCTDLKKVLDMVDDQVPLGDGLLKNWSLKNVFDENEDSCSRICIDYSGHPQLLCKLIFWVISNVLVQPNPIPFQSISSHSIKINEDPSNDSLVLLGEGQTDKTEHGSSFTQNDHELKSEHVGLIGEGINDLETDTGTGNMNVIPSSSEVTPIGDPKNVYRPIRPDNKSPDVKDNAGTDAKQSSDTTKSVYNGQDETHVAVNSAESTKNTENSAGHRPRPSTTSTKQETEINKNPEKSSPKVDADSVKLSDIIFDENPSVGPHEKMPTDVAGRGDEIGDQFHSSFNDDLDDDDMNVQPNEQLPMNHETTGYKTDTGNKYSQDEFPNSNTFLQERFEDSEDSHFFSYFMAMVVLCIVGYVVFHNKQKILALALEGRSRRTTRRRPATANYHKLDNNLEEAVSSPCNTSVTHVIY